MMYALWVHARDINNQAQADAVVARAQASGITDVFFQVIDDGGRAHYNSTAMSGTAAGLFTKCPDVGAFDPLAYLAGKIRTHAWICVGTDPLRVHPEWDAKRTRNLGSAMPSWLDLTRADARQFVVDWCAGLLNRYPNVGLHLDYLRWHTDYGDNHLPWATAAAITQTMQQIRAALLKAPISVAVSSDPTGTLFGNMQAWGGWTSWVNVFIIMAYPNSVLQLQNMMARSASYSKSQIAIGLSGLYFTYNPYTETKVPPAILTDLVNWARSAGYVHFAWFDYTKIVADQYAIIAQLAPTQVDLYAVAKNLSAIATELKVAAARQRTDATTLELKAADIEKAAGEVSDAAKGG